MIIIVLVCRLLLETRFYGKRQTSDSRLCILKINNTYTRMVHNISYAFG